MTTATRYPGHGVHIGWTTAALLALLAATVSLSLLSLGVMGLWLGLAIATVKAAIIAWWFMELRASPATVRFVAVLTLLWVLLMLGGTLGDVATRHERTNPSTLATPESLK